MPLDGDAGYIPGIVAAGRCGKHTWAEIGAFFDRSRHTVRVRYYRYKDGAVAPVPCPLCARAGGEDAGRAAVPGAGPAGGPAGRCAGLGVVGRRGGYGIILIRAKEGETCPR